MMNQNQHAKKIRDFISNTGPRNFNKKKEKKNVQNNALGRYNEEKWFIMLLKAECFHYLCDDSNESAAPEFHKRTSTSELSAKFFKQFLIKNINPRKRN